MTVPRLVATWMAPAWGWYKLNVDASFDQIKTRWFHAVVSARKKHLEITLALHADLVAIYFGLDIIRCERILAQFVEFDSLLAINEIKQRHNLTPPWLSLLLDICYLKMICGVKSFDFFLRPQTS